MTRWDEFTARLRAQRIALAARLEAAPTEDRSLIVTHAAIDTGGHVIPNTTQNGWGSVEATVTLLGITGFGDDLDAAIAHWIKCARRAERAMAEERAA